MKKEVEGYIPKDSRKKILLLSDDFRLPSGVGTISKEIILGTAQKFNWVQIAAGINHYEAGRTVDVSEAVNQETGLEDSSVILYPNNGYGDVQILRKVMSKEHPDAIFIFTDPRYWTWLFNMEREIRSQIPIIYLNIWDDLPYPLWNKPYYESCDALFAISKQTYNINRVVLGDEAKNRVIKYIPHGVSSCFHPVDSNDLELEKFRKRVFGDNIPKFTLLYNARNLSRKRAADIIVAWKIFCETIPFEKSKECCLLMHTDKVDNSGTDLETVYRDLCDTENTRIVFSEDKFSTEEMNLLYNLSDGVILISSNEGWGLSLTEALLTGKMIIANVSGGMQDQMRFEDSTGRWIDFSKDFPSNHLGNIQQHGNWAIPVFPSSISVNGSPKTPYVFDDRDSIQDIRNAIERLYRLLPETRKEYGMEGREWAISSEAGFTAKEMCNRIVEGIYETFDRFVPRANFEILDVHKELSRKKMIDYSILDYNYVENNTEGVIN